MKIAHFADLHLDASFKWAPPDVARQRRQGLRSTLARILQHATEQEVDAIFCGGDLFEHSRISPDTEELLRKSFQDVAPIPVFLAPGNHDYYGPESFYQRAGWSPNVHVFTEARFERFELADGISLWGAAHCVPANTPGFLDSFSVDGSGLHLALFHGSERGWFSEQEDSKQPHASFDGAQIEQAGFSHAFLGHFHNPKHASTYTYPGNPDPLQFGETGERGLVIAEIGSDGRVNRTSFKVASTDVHDIRVDISGLTTRDEILNATADILEGKRGLARITVYGELEPTVDITPADLTAATPWMDAVVVRFDSLTDAFDFEMLAEEPTVRGEFVRGVQDSDLSEAEKRRVLLTGLRALDGRQDLGVF